MLGFGRFTYLSMHVLLAATGCKKRARSISLADSHGEKRREEKNLDLYIRLRVGAGCMHLYHTLLYSTLLELWRCLYTDDTSCLKSIRFISKSLI